MKPKFIIIQLILLFIGHKAFAQELISNSIAPATYFVNHVNYLETAKANLNKYRQTSIIGISGIGKTQLARMYAYENKRNYDLIWFFDCNLDIDEEFLTLAKNINRIAGSNIIKENNKSVKKDVMDYLVSRDRWLLVLDNLKVKSNKKILDFVNWEHNGNILFCSQDSEKLPNIITLDILTNEDASILANNILENKDPRAIEFLINEFKGYPILVVQGAQLLKTIKGLSAEEYKKKLGESTNKIELNIELAISNLSHSAKDLLYKIALINNQRFSKEIMGMLVDNEDILDADLYQLSKFVLISCVDTNPNNPIFEMHDIVAQSIKKINGDKNNKYYLEEIISKLVKSIPGGVYKAHIFRNAATMHENLEVTLKNEQIYNSNIYKTMELNLHLLGNYSNASDFHNAEKIVNWFEEKDQKSEFKLSLMNNYEKGIYAGYLGTIGTYNRKRMADHKTALKYYNRADVIFKEVLGREDWKFNLAYLSALSNISLGYMPEAEKEINRLEAIASSGLVDKGDLGLIHRIKAKLNYYQGNYNEALIEVNQGISESIKHGVKADDAVLTAPYVFKAAILNILKRYQEAYTQTEILQNMHKSSKKEDHLVYGRIFTQKARSEVGLAKTKESLGSINKAIAILLADETRNSKNSNFFEDEDLGDSYTIQGDIFVALNRLQDAIESYRKAQGIYFHLYQDRSKNIAHVSYLYTQGAKAACKKQDLYHYKCFYEPQVKEFGAQHSNSVSMFEYCKPYNMDLLNINN